jgi:iron complex transport system permease protein
VTAIKERPRMSSRVLSTPRGGLSVRITPRSVVVVVVLAIAVFFVGAVSLTTGDYPLTVGEVIQTLFGFGDRSTEFIVTTLRLPRLLTALLVGGALAVSGAILQSLSGNPLGSPDFIGFSEGAAAGALLVIVVAHGGMFEVSLGALAGGIVTATVIALLAFKRGVHGFRLILIGIGVNAMLLAFNSYLITRAAWQDGLAAQAWLVGGLNGRGWEHAVPVGIAVAALLPLAFIYGRRLSLLEMGDDSAKGLGVPVERSRLVLIAVSVGLCSVATAAAGPIAFLALAAPQLAKRLTRSSGPGLAAAALMGMLLLVTSDLITQQLLAGLPVGLATGAIGGLYLAWLLVSRGGFSRAAR